MPNPVTKDKKISPRPQNKARGWIQCSSIMTSKTLNSRRCSSTGRSCSFREMEPLSWLVVTSNKSARSWLASHWSALAMATKVFNFGVLLTQQQNIADKI